MEQRLVILLLEYRKLTSKAHGILDEIFSLVTGKCYKVTYSDKYENEKSFFLNRHSKSILRDFLLNPEEGEVTSDYMKDYCFGEVYDVKVEEVIRKKTTEGSYFPYYNLSDEDLSPYQIYKKERNSLNERREEEDEKEPDPTHCLVYSLERQGIDCSQVVNYVSGYVKMSDLKQIAGKLGIQIWLHHIPSTTKRINKYPPTCPDGTVTAHVALYKDHYFSFEKIGKSNSLYLVRDLFNEGLFEPMETNGTTKRQEKEVELEVCIGEQAPFEFKKSSDSERTNGGRKKNDKVKKKGIFFADTECVLKPYHKAFLYARVGDDYKVYQEGGDWKGFRTFLNSFPGEYNVVYFHNLKYDWFVLKKCPFIKIRSVVVKDATYYKVVFSLGRKVFELRDSFKLIPKKLADFSRTFDLEEKKQDFILYHLYDLANSFSLERDYVEYEDYSNQEFVLAYDVTPEGYQLAETPVQNSIIIDGRIVVSKKVFDHCGRYFSEGRYYHLAHCRTYIHYDCLVLKRGVERFRENMLELLKTDCYDFLTLPSMVHARACQLGCYEGVYSLEDNLREFVARSIQGGKVCTKDNAMWLCDAETKPIDAKSMYPSAIDRICREGGFPKGPAKVIKNFVPDEYFYYVVEVNVLSVGKYQQLPFVSYLEEDGTRTYTNELHNKKLVVDKITLEDWIKFQDVKYEFVRGIYWDEGGQDNMGEFIRTLYEKRIEYVNQGNSSMSEVCKLALNSLYGKTIVKPTEIKVVIKDNDKVDDYIRENFERLISMEECGIQSILTLRKSKLGHSSLVHVGGMILSMARRMVNEVEDLATDLGVHVLYQDTDSLHVVDKCEDYSGGIENLIINYQKRYGKDLVGLNLGQFDYDLKGENKTSKKCIILGKKAYIHWVDSENQKYVMSGVNSNAMNEHPDKLSLYERLFKGEEIAFDLAYGGGPIFNYRDVVTTKEKCEKKVSYKGERKMLK
jgi:hypothetical protein